MTGLCKCGGVQQQQYTEQGCDAANWLRKYADEDDQTINTLAMMQAK